MYYAFNLALHLKCFLYKLPRSPRISNYSKSDSVPNIFPFLMAEGNVFPTLNIKYIHKGLPEIMSLKVYSSQQEQHKMNFSPWYCFEINL